MPYNSYSSVNDNDSNEQQQHPLQVTVSNNSGNSKTTNQTTSNSDNNNNNSFDTVILGLFHPVFLYPIQLARSCIFPLFFSHRVIVAVICLFLFPIFIFTTLISSLLGIIINHMVHNTNPNSPSSPSSSSVSSSSSSSSNDTSHDGNNAIRSGDNTATTNQRSFRHHHASTTRTRTTLHNTTMMDQVQDTNNSNDDNDEEDEEEEDDHQDMDYWLQRCSICFDAQLDLCLEYCRDQYCSECFERYVTEVVTSSWGLSVTKIRCPVCQDPIPQSEWSKFVPSSVVEHYNRYNQPYRSFSRCCPNCETEVIPCDHQDAYHQGGPEKLYTMLKELIQSNGHDGLEENSVEKQRIQQLLPIVEKQEWTNSSLPDHYQRIILAVMALEQKKIIYMTNNDETRNRRRMMMMVAPPQSPQSSQEQQPQSPTPSIMIMNSNNDNNNCGTGMEEEDRESERKRMIAMSHKNALAISKTMLLFEMKPDTWRKLQFQHIGIFPHVDCPECLVTFCLQCGQREHPNLTCEESMQKIVDNNCGPTEFIETVRWQLRNSRRCPNCSIMINRDEGCNKVDCSLCGFCFCWACRSPWSEKCGFYHCAEANAEQLALNSPELSEAQTELGVPNVSSIQARLFPIT